MIDISIIIPIYNVEKYIQEFIDSIKYQNNPRVEYIFVDDGSTDQSIEIIKKNIDFFDNYKIIKKKNGGLSSARNEGLKHCIGKYVTFIDSDDTVKEDFLTVLLDNLGYDLSMFDYTRFNDTSVHDYSLSINEGIYKKELIVNYFISNLYGLETLPITYYVFPMVWGKLYKLDIIRENNILFLSERVYNSEDSLFNIMYLSKCNHINYVKKSIINYRVNNESLTNKTKKDDFYFARDNLMKKYKEYSGTFEKNSSKKYEIKIIFECIQWFQFCFFNKNTYISNKKHFKTIYTNSFLENESRRVLEHLNELRINKTYKMFFLLLYHRFYAVCYIIQYLKNAFKGEL